MTTRTITVPEIHCGHCKTSIEEAVSALDGIRSVDVDIEPRTVRLSYDESRVGMEDIRGTIEAIGYEVPEQT